MDSAPPAELLQLIKAFLTVYGLPKTGKAFTAELDALQKNKSWKTEVTKVSNKSLPSLVSIFDSWRHGAGAKSATKSGGGAGVSSSDDNSSDAEEATKKKQKNGTKKVAGKASSNVSDSESSSSNDTDTDSESGSDSESNNIIAEAPKTIPSKLAKTGVKRKIGGASGSDSSMSSDSDSDSSSSDSSAPAKKQKITETKSKAVKLNKQATGKKEGTGLAPPSDSSQSDSSSDSGSDESSSSDSDENAKMNVDRKPSLNGTKIRGDSKTSTDSSKTLNGDSGATPTKKRSQKQSEDSDSDASSSSASSSDGSSSGSSSANQKSRKTTSTAKHDKKSKLPQSVSPALPVAEGQVTKKNIIPFSRIPKNIKVDPRLASNEYVPYDYAQRAHEDLIVTKGKGFTKEKNKKKRGSYRGGFIDTSGGKGIKFDD